MNTSGKLIMVGMIRDGNRISKYLLLDINSQKLLIKSIKECLDLLDSRTHIIGLQKNGPHGIIKSGGFKYRPIVGEEANEVFTVLKRIAHKTYKEYDISDSMGQIKRVTEDELINMMNNNVGINAITKRKSGLALVKGLDTVIEQ